MNLYDKTINSIGGYFELELPSARCLPYGNLLRFQSARAAFLALILAGKPKKVWMPRYLCNAMITPLQFAQVECAWYDVDNQFVVDKNISIKSDDWLLYVNYFGICNNNIDELLGRISPDQVVLDCAQAFFSAPIADVVATIYSPRKFFGVPDGGLLCSRIFVPSPSAQDAQSIKRMSHLISRLGDSPEAGYPDYQYAEESLTECEPKRMSKLTDRILSSVDFDHVSKKRQENFLFLHKMLGPHNLLTIDAKNITAPLCYPYITQDADLRRKLISHRIFVATYWEDSISRVGDCFAERIVRNLLPLPIDQRYGRNDLERMVAIILGVNT